MTSLSAPTPSQLTTSLTHKTVLITGGASGIGLATAKLFASAQARVVIADVGGHSRLAGVAAEISRDCLFFECDVSSWDAQTKLFKDVVAEVGRVDVVFLNAAVHVEMPTVQDGEAGEMAKKRVACDFLAGEVEIESKSDDRPVGGGAVLKSPDLKTFEINLFGVMYGLKLAVHQMRKQQDGGRIIVTASANAYLAIPSSAQYDASKHAVLGLARSVAQREDLQRSGITVSVLCPSMTMTPMTAMVGEEKLAFLKSKSEPADVAWGVAWLVVEDKENVRGKTVLVKGRDLFEVEDSYRGWMLPLFGHGG